MLRINQQRSAAGAKSYFEEGLAREDYYTQDAIVGRWGGQAAERLGLSGDVTRQAFLALCDNRDPNTGHTLTARTRENRTVGYDFNFHAPKSLSLLYTLTKDERLLRAFQGAVRATMQELEADVKTRVRAGGVNAERVTGNLAYAEFVHLTARPVGGEPDPHLHAHCFVFNATFDATEDRFKAAQFREVVRDAPYFEAAFHTRLSKAVADLGLAVERTANGWEVAGVERATLDKFSRRTALIEELARDRGITDAHEKAELGARTREKKGESRSLDALRQEWKGRLTTPEVQQLRTVLAGRAPSPDPAVSPAAAVDHALAHGFERASVMAARRVLATALKRGYGSVAVEAVAAEFAGRHEVIRREWQDQTFVTTREVLAEEAAALDFARAGRGTCQPLDPAGVVTSDRPLNPEQLAAVAHVLTSQDRVMLIRGAAGTGKTTLLRAAHDTLGRAGVPVHVFAPTTEAARGVLRKDGFADAETVARLLADAEFQKRVNGGVIWVDEAGLLGTRELRALFAVADAQDARVVLMGDERQHSSVPRGDAFRLLQSHAGLPAVTVGTVQRQTGEYKRAVEALARGDLADGFERLDRLGFIAERSGEERHRDLAADYLAAVKDGKSALVVAPTHREGRAVTALVRSELRAQGLLGGSDRAFDQLTSRSLTVAERADATQYRQGDVVRFHQNARGGFRKGAAYTIADRGPDGQVLVRQGRGREVALPLAEARHFDVYDRSALPVAVGDRLRVTQNGTAAGGKGRLLNGSLHTVAGFNRRGDILLDGGLVVPRDFGHLAHGYCTTSHASQGKTVDRVFVALGAESYAAASREQFYVSVSRGRESVKVYCEDKAELLEAVSHSAARPAAVELTDQPPRVAARARLLRHGEHRRREDVIRERDSRGDEPRPVERERERGHG
jgi:conjugative relaxase-like TrwC/TraI family protein